MRELKRARAQHKAEAKAQKERDRATFKAAFSDGKLGAAMYNGQLYAAAFRCTSAHAAARCYTNYHPPLTTRRYDP